MGPVKWDSFREKSGMSPLHCSSCRHDLLILSNAGLLCERCGTPVVEVSLAEAEMRARIELAVRRIRQRLLGSQSQAPAISTDGPLAF